MVVKVLWFRELEKSLKDPVKVGGVKEVFTSGDVRDVLRGVVDDHCEVIGGADVLAGENGVAEKVRVDFDRAMLEIIEGKRAGEVGGFLGVEAPGWFAIWWWGLESSAGAGIERAFRAVRSVAEMTQFGFDFASGAVAGVKDIQRT